MKKLSYKIVESTNTFFEHSEEAHTLLIKESEENWGVKLDHFKEGKEVLSGIQMYGKEEIARKRYLECISAYKNLSASWVEIDKDLALQILL